MNRSQKGSAAVVLRFEGDRALLIGIASLIVNLVLATLWPNFACSIAATCLFALVLWQLLRRDPEAVWLLFPFALTELSVLVSLNAIDAGAYMPEMGEFARPSSAAASFACYSVVLLLASIYVFRAITGPPRIRASPQPVFRPGMAVMWQWGLLIPCIALVSYLLLAGLRTGYPLLIGMDRFLFRRMYADVVTVAVLNLKVVLSFPLGSIAAFSDRRALRRAAFFCFIGLLGTSFLYGDKFFTILESIGSFFVPFVLKDPDAGGKRLLRSLPLILASMASVFLVTLFIYSDLGTRGIDGALIRFGERVAGQGELWAVAVTHSPHWINFDVTLIADNLDSLIARTPQDFAFDHHIGAEYFSYKYSPPAMYRSFQHNAGFVTPTMGYEAYGLVLFGYIGLLGVMIATGFLLGVLLSWLRGVMIRGELFAILLPACVMSEVTKLLSQGTLYNVVSISTFKIYAAFFLLQVLVAAAARGTSPALNRRAAFESVAAP